MKSHSFILVAMGLAAAPLWAGTWYADASRPDDSGDGLSSATAKKCIQSAVALANASDDATRLVIVAPGTYAEGSHADSKGGKSRVLITKPMTLKSSGSREDTFIEGVLSSEAYGLGTDSVRGVCVDGVSSGEVVIQGFTIRMGAASVTGGGAVCNTGAATVYMKDCAALDCAGVKGGGGYGVVAIRTLFKGCHNNNKNKLGSALCDSTAYMCVFDSCGSSESYSEYILQGDGPYVNCTAVGNSGSLLRTSSSQQTYNVMSLLPTRQEFDNTNSGGDYVIMANSNGQGQFTNRHCYANDSAESRALIVSSLTGDYHPQSGSAAVNFGDPQWCRSDWIPADDRAKDFYGDAFDTTGAAGSVHCGAVQTVKTVASGALIVPSVYPTTDSATATINRYAYATAWPAQRTMSVAADVFAVSFGSDAPVRYPARDGTFVQTFPSSGSVATASNIAATATLEVGSGKAYATIQAAIDAASSDEDAATVIEVAPGTYAPITIHSKNIRLRATGGKSVTTIQGVKDTSGAGDASGCGPDAQRCVTVTAGGRFVAIEGFTLKGGATAVGSGTYPDTPDATSGGGVCVMDCSGYNPSVQLIGCDIVDCVGYNASAVFGAWLHRAAIHGCRSSAAPAGHFMARKTLLTASVLYDNSEGGDVLVGNGSIVQNCAISALCGGYNQSALSTTSYLRGSIVQSASVDTLKHAAGSVVFRTSGTPQTATGFITDDPRLAAPDYGRLMVASGSPALDLWNVSEAAGSSAAPWLYLTTDYEGNAFAFTADGCVTAGAYQQPHEPVDLYADAAKTDDSGDGLTAATAKRTLAAALALASYGDTVHAAAGTYDAGMMTQSVAQLSGQTFTVPSRARVLAGVTLAGAGADETVIKGGYAADETVRCVFMETNTCLKGFTLADGLCVTNAQTAAYDDCYAAGILANRASVVEDCLITNAHARNCGGVWGGTFRRCRFIGNWAWSTIASAGSFLVAENGLFSANRGASIVADYRRIDSCTFLYDNVNVNGNRISTFGTCQTDAVIRNSVLILSPTSQTDAKLPSAVHCLIPALNGDSWRWHIDSSENCILNETTFAKSWNGVPTADYVGLDRGTASGLPSGGDLLGKQRVWNAAPDIGAIEYDWSGAFAAKLSPKGLVTVEATSGTVTNRADGLSLAAGACVTLRSAAATTCALALSASVTDGTITVSVNGTQVGTLSATTTRLELGVVAPGAKIEIAFSSGASAEAVLKGIVRHSGLLILFS